MKKLKSININFCKHRLFIFACIFLLFVIANTFFVFNVDRVDTAFADGKICIAEEIQSKVYNGETQVASFDNFTYKDYFEVTENEGGTDAGKYDVSIKIKDEYFASYQWSTNYTSQTFTLINAFEITKLTNSINSFTFNGWTYGDEKSSLPSGVTDKHGKTVSFSFEGATGTTYAESETMPTNAGSYYIIASSSGDKNTESATRKVKFTIEKKYFNIENVSFNNLICDYDGEVKSIEVNDGLIDGVTVTFDSNNSQTLPGIYNVVASFTANENFRLSAKNKTLQLVIMGNKLEQQINVRYDKPEVIIDFNSSVSPNVELVADSNVDLKKIYKNDTQTIDKINKLLKDKEVIAMVYDVKLVEDDSEYELNQNIDLKLFIPKSIGNNDFKVYHVHNGEISEVEFEKDGDYVKISTNKLSEFVFVNEENVDTTSSNTALIIIASVCAVVVVALAVGFIVLSKRKKIKK